MSVVDASVLVSIFYPPDVNHQVSRQWLERHVLARRSLTLPRLALAELAGAIARNANDTTVGLDAVAALRTVPRLTLVDIDTETGELAVEIAAGLRLRGADALYVALAAREGLALVTWDKE